MRIENGRSLRDSEVAVCDRQSFLLLSLFRYNARVLWLCMLPDSSLPGYKERRKGFVKVAVELGQTVTVELPVDGRSLQHYDPQFEAWCVEPGAFEVLVGTSSADVSLRTTFTARGPNPYAYGPRTTVAKLFADPRAREVLARHLPA